MSEQELWIGCKKRIPRVQNELVKIYTSELIKICRKYTINNEDAEDIVQEALIKILNKIDQFKGDGSFDGWMKRITINIALKKYKRLRCKKEINTDITLYEFNNITTHDVVSDLSFKELINILDKLPNGYKKIFELCAIEGFSHEEISKMLGIKPVTSRSQYAKARQHIIKLIAKNESKD